MRALKVLVIAMGIAILVGTTVLITVIVQRGSRLAEGSHPPVAADPVPGQTRLLLPAGARVLETSLSGGNIVLRAALADGGEAIFVFVAASGRRLARHDIVREPAP